MSLVELSTQTMQPQAINAMVVTVALPMLAAFILPMLDRLAQPVTRLIGPLVLIVSLLFTYHAWQTLTQPYMISIGGFAPPTGIVFYVDQLSLLFTALVLTITLLLWPYHKDTSNREYSLTLLLAAAACGLALSGDLFNIYVFYELASVASFGLVAATATGAAFAATIRYVIISSLGSVLALTGIAIVYTLTGTLNLAHLAQLAPTQLANPTGTTAFVLILLGIGVKAELFPVNTWVPQVYATAKKRVSALLAGLLSKLAVLVLIRLLVLVFHSEQALQIMLVLGVLGVISGEFAAWRATDMTRMLAYSSIGQLGMVFIAFSIPGSAGLLAGLAVAFHHALVKPALFLLAERWGNSLLALRGAAYVSPIGAILLILFSLSLIGVPPFPGFWAKLLVVTGLATQETSLYALAMLVILIATVVEANYFIRIMIALYTKAPVTRETAPVHSGPTLKTHSTLNLATASLMGIALIGSIIFIMPIAQQLEHTANQASNVQSYITTVFPAGSRSQ